jgi:hypothetical protein
MPATSSDDIIVVDLMTSSFSTIQLLQGVKYQYFESIVSRGVYLIHVEEFQLHAWLHKGNNWLLVDAICLHEMFATLDMSDHTLEDDGTAKVQIIQMGDNQTMVNLFS